jgi:hypothetical protein
MLIGKFEVPGFDPIYGLRVLLFHNVHRFRIQVCAMSAKSSGDMNLTQTALIGLRANCVFHSTGALLQAHFASVRHSVEMK